MDILSKEFTVLNEMGMHARPAAILVQAVANLDCDLVIESDGERVNGKSIMGILMLALEPGRSFTVHSTGPDAAQALEIIERLINERFGES